MIAVSGASGFLGSYVVCMLLEQGKKVRAFKRAFSSMNEFERIFAYYFKHKNAEQQQELLQLLSWQIADINDLPSLDSSLTGIEEVYHCAAIVSFLQKDHDLLMKVNVEGTTNMVNMCLQKGIKKFCHVSSIAALGRAKSGDSVSEKTKWNHSKHNSNYALSKYKAEMEVWRASEEGLNVIIVNPGVILGVGNWNKGSCKLFQLVWKGMPFFTNGVNGYVDVKDVAKAMIELTQKEIYNQRFVLVGKNVNMQWYLNTVAAYLGKKKPFIKVNKLLAQIAWRVDAVKSFVLGKTPSLTKETARASLNQFYYNSHKIEQTIGFKFTPMEQTIEETCKQFMASIQ